jgi:para-nitrobenzyl esterase
VWQYQFERPLPGTGATSTRHSGELPYVFGAPRLPGNRMLGAAFGEADAEISKAMQSYWANFVKTGNPNGTGVPNWPKFTKDSAAMMRFTSDGPVVSKNARVPLCQLYQINLELRLASKE